ncbi:Uncharacterized protein FWK35_00002183, partial [Aphis craccivora]
MFKSYHAYYLTTIIILISRHDAPPSFPISKVSIKRRPAPRFRHNTFLPKLICLFHFCFYCSLHFISLQENQPKSKMGAEKVSMNIVVVGQVQSAKAIKTVAKAAPATSQLMFSPVIVVTIK